MRGLYLKKNNDCLENVKQETASLSLLAKGDCTEVLQQKINSNIHFCVEPSLDNELMEFFYIIEGKIKCSEHEQDNILKKGDYFYTHCLSEPAHFRTIEDTTLIYVSSKPVFHYLSETIGELNNIMGKIELKDKYTHSHCTRVRHYSLKIGEKLNLSREKKEILGFSALFHDIGKFNVPDSILNKPSRLTDKEMEYIKKHPLDGSKMVGNSYYENTSKIIEQHHERLDGSGYPYGLKEDEILLEAKIIAVADCYDAMTTDRPYKKGKPPLDAIQELKELSGKFYDREVVNAFEEVLKEENII